VLQLAGITQRTGELTAQEKKVKGSNGIAAWAGNLPRALHKISGRSLNEARKVLTKPECFVIMVSHLAVGHSRFKRV
jgi:hypothetical protein